MRVFVVTSVGPFAFGWLVGVAHCVIAATVVVTLWLRRGGVRR